MLWALSFRGKVKGGKILCIVTRVFDTDTILCFAAFRGPNRFLVKLKNEGHLYTINKSEKSWLARSKKLNKFT